MIDKLSDEFKKYKIGNESNIFEIFNIIVKNLTGSIR